MRADLGTSKHACTSFFLRQRLPALRARCLEYGGDTGHRRASPCDGGGTVFVGDTPIWYNDPPARLHPCVVSSAKAHNPHRMLIYRSQPGLENSSQWSDLMNYNAMRGQRSLWQRRPAPLITYCLVYRAHETPRQLFCRWIWNMGQFAFIKLWVPWRRGVGKP